MTSEARAEIAAKIPPNRAGGGQSNDGRRYRRATTRFGLQLVRCRSDFICDVGESEYTEFSFELYTKHEVARPCDELRRY
jgi:hypothetical protein